MTVLRFANAEVLERPAQVYVTILTALRTLTPALRAAPLPQGERGRKEKIS
ncbi:hypothetical protein GGQ62_002238 [Polymorphobacter fuscus]|nr:hypothetical protein [Polymorphobacter fuscus]